MCWDFWAKPGGENDKTLLEESGGLEKIPIGKLAIVDRGYINQRNKDKLSWPNLYDSPEVNNFKSRVRLRHETFNRRLKDFNMLSERFQHNLDKHKAAFEAIVVIVQYQMDNGSPIFDV